MKIKLLFLFVILFSLKTNAQTVTALQQQNARATGYAIVAARNPGKSFSVLLVKWDGINTLDYNATTQINSAWHAQAAVKGNYFDQTFNGTDFTMYSSVVVSQAEFDTYKSTGTDWWIVCSLLPAFSNSGLTIAENGNVGIGTTTPNEKLDVIGNAKLSSYSPTLILQRDTNVGGFTQGIQTRNSDNSNNWFFGNLHSASWIVSKGDYQNPKLTINENGNVGIGTTNPDEKLTVKGKIHAEEVKVDLLVPADYVFQKYYTGKSELKSDYSLPTLAEIESFSKKNHHLPNVPSAKEMQQNGVSLGEMSNVLLQKVEELTLYAIEQNKVIEELKAQVTALMAKKQ